jgi:mevalonate pyrophosphate decarboxylase
MNKAIILLVCLLSSTFISYAQTNCFKLPSTFKSYNQATTLVKATKFKIIETANTSKSTWVKSATYYSCDGKTGYLIILLKSKEYIHANLPYSIWKGFKNASSKGKYYDNNIKHKYQLRVN